MSMFQKMVDSLIKKELDNVKATKIITEEEAKAIHQKETRQAKINALLEKEKNKKND